MNADNFMDSLQVWYSHYHDLREGKQTYDVKAATALAQSIIEQMHMERAKICEALDIQPGATAREIVARIAELWNI